MKTKKGQLIKHSTLNIFLYMPVCELILQLSMQHRTAMLVDNIAKAIPHIRLLVEIYEESNGFDREIFNNVHINIYFFKVKFSQRTLTPAVQGT